MLDDHSLYPGLRARTAWWNVGASHDLSFEVSTVTYGRETFKRLFGPNDYAFDHAPANLTTLKHLADNLILMTPLKRLFTPNRKVTGR
jgi:hypothetical protein